MFMNKTKRYLTLTAAILNLVAVVANFVISMLIYFNPNMLETFTEFYFILSLSTGIVYSCITFVLGLLGSFFLLYAIRNKGKFFRTTQGLYFSGFVIVLFTSSFIVWILLLISWFMPDIIVMNTKSEVRKEERQENNVYEDKKRKIEDLKRMRDDGIISEDEYKQKLFDIL